MVKSNGTKMKKSFANTRSPTCPSFGKVRYAHFSKASLSMITVLILLAASFIVLIAFEAPLLAKLLSLEKQQRCEATVAVHKATKLFDFFNSPVPIVCPRTQVDFYSDHVEIDQKKVSVVIQNKNKKQLITSYGGTKEAVLNEDIINPVFAEQLRKCWKSFGEGLGATPFDRNAESDRSVCVICSQITLKENAVYTKDMLLNYLKKTTIPMSDQNYFDYLNLQQVNPSQQIGTLQTYIQNFEINKAYYIFLRHQVYGKVHNVPLLSSLVSLFATPVIGAKIEVKDAYYIMLIDHQQLQQNKAECTQLYG